MLREPDGTELFPLDSCCAQGTEEGDAPKSRAAVSVLELRAAGIPREIPAEPRLCPLSQFPARQPR